MLLVQPREGDPLIDATHTWPAEREMVEVDRLRITSVSPAGAPGPCEPVMFNPLLLPPGIEPSEDPILLGRPAPCAVSLQRRLQ